jgi:hypothetical protein
MHQISGRDVLIGGLAAMALFLVVTILKRPPAASTDFLDKPLVHLSEQDHLTGRDALSGGVFVCGASGSGKSSGSTKTFLDAMIGHRFPDGRPAFGLLGLLAKPEERQVWMELCLKHGRLDDVFVMAPGSGVRLNVLDTGKTVREMTRILMTIADSLRGVDGDGERQQKFWARGTERLIQYTIEIVQAAYGTVTPDALQRFLSGMATTPGQTENAEWRQAFHYQTIEKAWENARSMPEDRQQDIKTAVEHFLNALPALANETRSGFVAGADNILTVFNSPIVRSLCGSDSTISPDLTLQSKILLVDLPPSEFGDEGSFVNAAQKFVVQRRVLARKAMPGDSLHCIVADECHRFLNSFDATYTAESRSHLGMSLMVTQNLPSCYRALGGSKNAEYQVQEIIGNLTTKIIHALSCTTTATWASKLVGETMHTDISGNSRAGRDMFDALMGSKEQSTGFHTNVRSTLVGHEFTTNLRVGGPPDYVVDSFVIRNGVPFNATGDNWCRATWTQR